MSHHRSERKSQGKVPPSAQNLTNRGILTLYKNVDTQEMDQRRFTLHYQVTASSAGTTILNTVIPMTSASSVDWGLVSGYYDEFRVLGIRLHFISLQQFSVTAANAVLYVCFDNDDSTALTSYNQAIPYCDKRIMSTVMVHPAGKVPNITFVRPSTASSPIPWIDVGASTSSLGAVKLYADSLTASIPYLNIAVEYFIEVRGRR